MKHSHRNKTWGQALPEYALILALVAVFCVASLRLFGGSFSNFFTFMGNTLRGVVTTPPG